MIFYGRQIRYNRQDYDQQRYYFAWIDSPIYGGHQNMEITPASQKIMGALQTFFHNANCDLLNLVTTARQSGYQATINNVANINNNTDDNDDNIQLSGCNMNKTSTTTWSQLT